MKRVWIAVTLVLMWGMTPADAAPSQALNKTITISFSATGTATPIGGQPRGFSTAITQTIYVSSAGRIFRKFTAASGRGKGRRDGSIAPGEGNGSFSFRGDRLVGIVPFGMGARQVTVSFSSDFTSCTAVVIEGKASSGVIRRVAPNGETVEVSNGTTTSPSCSIQSGNGIAE